MKRATLLIILCLPLSIFGQDCDCTSNFEWVKQTFEENDAGFSYAIESKGEQAYQQHNQVFKEKVAQITNSIECTETLSEWLTFFRSGHIGISRLNNESSTGGEEKSNEAVIESFKDWEKLEVDITEFKQYLNAKKTHDFEGIWASEPYEIGIKKEGEEYLGFIIKADGVYWTAGQIKLRINQDHSSTYYMQDHSAQNFKSAELLGNNYLEMGFITLERVTPKLKSDPLIEGYFKAMSTSMPYFETIDEQTVYLRIPTFSGTEKPNIDSVIMANRAMILKTPNLIVDIRNNGGGSDRSFGELLPLLYTNPIRTVGVELLSTPLNNQRMLDFINSEEWGLTEEEKKWAQEAYDKLAPRIGAFVNLDTAIVDITTFDTIHPFPQNIAIIINEGNGSTAEQFLLAAKQSRKVKLYGTTTAGVLDISNMYFVKSPCEEFGLSYSLSRSMRIPEMTIDEKGIQPDYYIDKGVPKYKWLNFVTDSLKE